MGDSINNADLFSSGGHRWSWPGGRNRKNKVLAATGTEGEGSILLQLGGRPGQIAGILKASASDRDSADSAINAMEAAIEALADSGKDYAWKDDVGHTGEHLKVVSYKPDGDREYGRSGSSVEAWQRFRVDVLDLDGKFA